MHSYPTDVTPMIGAIAAALTMVVIVSRLLSWYRSRTPRLRLLTGTRPQRAALRLALAPVLREFLPLLDRAGQDVRAIVLVPTLSGSNGEPLAAEVEQLGGSATFVVRLAHRLGATVRPPDDIAGALAEDLLYLYRQAAAVTLVRQTPATAGPAAAAAQGASGTRAIGRNGLTPVPRHGAQNEAEETVTAFRPSPLGHNNNQGS
jgi:hypothetical protein